MYRPQNTVRHCCCCFAHRAPHKQRGTTILSISVHAKHVEMILKESCCCIASLRTFFARTWIDHSEQGDGLYTTSFSAVCSVHLGLPLVRVYGKHLVSSPRFLLGLPSVQRPVKRRYIPAQWRSRTGGTPCSASSPAQGSGEPVGSVLRVVLARLVHASPLQS